MMLIKKCRYLPDSLYSSSDFNSFFFSKRMIDLTGIFLLPNLALGWWIFLIVIQYSIQFSVQNRWFVFLILIFPFRFRLFFQSNARGLRIRFSMSICRLWINRSRTHFFVFVLFVKQRNRFNIEFWKGFIALILAVIVSSRMIFQL